MVMENLKNYKTYKNNIESNQSMTLDNVKPGHGGIITAIGGEGMLRRRLLDMGLTPNTPVEVRKIAPMGDPIEIYIRSYVLTIRREEAAKIAIKEVDKL
jgi:ferrous iron transport protein A